MDELKTLKDTQRILDNHGWTKGLSGWSGGPSGGGALCIEGAFLRAMGERVDYMYREPNPMQTIAMVEHPAYRLLVSMAGVEGGRLAGWNDSHSGWAVSDLLKRAIKRVEKEQHKQPAKLEVIIPPAFWTEAGGEKPVTQVVVVTSDDKTVYVPESWVSQDSKDLVSTST